MEAAPISVPGAVLDELRERLARTRLPNQVENAGWAMGTELDFLSSLLDTWRTEFDWRAQEARFNALAPTATEVDGQRIHFLHARSPEPDALPLLITHGWPGSVAEFLDVVGPLSDPRAHGGDPADAFHVVAPSLPGYGFSGPTSQPGWHPRRIAAAFASIMAELGYDRYGVQGGDWGSVVSQNVADLDEEHVCGMHLNFLALPRPKDAPEPTAEEQQAREALQTFRETGTGYQAIQATTPQTVGYGLEDSPAGLCAWIVEKMARWTDGDIEDAFSRDQLLTNVTLYWVTATATSSMRLYYEMRQAGGAAMPRRFLDVPTGVANFAGEITKTPRSWAERRFNITHWTELPRGGHFAALQVPELFVQDVRAFFQPLR
jgi:microsomal epoxide hydrolase